jgi:YVTN family beta-propeller protein
VPVGEAPNGVAVHPAGTFVYVVNHASDTVSVVDTATHAVVSTVPVGEAPHGMAVHPAGTFVYVTNTHGAAIYGESTTNGSVSVIDTATNTVTATVPVKGVPYGVAVHPAGTFVSAASFNGNAVSVIDSVTHRLEATLSVGERPVAFGQLIGPAGERGR